MASAREPQAEDESDKAFAALLDRATVRTPGGNRLLGPVSLAIRKGEHWAVLGPNGAGKTTLLRLLGAERHPSSGVVTVLGARLGASDLRSIRSRVGVVSHAVADRLPPSADALAVVLTGGRGVLAPWWTETTDAERGRGRQILAALGCSELADRPFGACSQGERQRVLLARSLFVEHPLLLLDEPCAGVDLPGAGGARAGSHRPRPFRRLPGDGSCESQPRGAAAHDLACVTSPGRRGRSGWAY